MQKIGEQHKNIEMVLKFTCFSMFKLMVLYFQPFLTHLFGIGHEKHPFEYVVDFDI
jgi:hypothetical protein